MPPFRHRFDPSLLREYDIRGIYGQTLHDADAYALGRCFALRVRQAGGSRIAVGYDGRLSSPALEQALVAGLVAGGIDVLRIGLGPTPLLYWVEASAEEVHGGIQVTGSHNPPDHNGFKIVLRGHPFFGPDIVDLGRVAAGGDGLLEAGASALGRVEEADFGGPYVERIVRALDGVDRAALAGLRLGWDCGNGAAGPVVERLARILPGHHELLFTAVDGHFPHHHPDPTEAKNLADLSHAVLSQRLDFGLAFDGDGDRLGVIDSKGRVLWGDQLLMILADDLLPRHPGARVIADVKASRHVFARVAAAGGIAEMGKTGHSHIKSRMKATGALLAGEMTGHLFFADDFHGVDDALYGALRLIAAVVRSGVSLTELRDALPETHASPDLRIRVDAARRLPVIEAVRDRLLAEGADVALVDGVRVTRPDGWWLLRASNTEAMVTARAESDSAAGLARLLDEIGAALAASGVALPGRDHGLT